MSVLIILFILQLINGMAQIKQAKFGVVDMDFVLGVGGYDLERSFSLYQLLPFLSVSEISESHFTSPHCGLEKINRVVA